jgi:hypothetical protein
MPTTRSELDQKKTQKVPKIKRRDLIFFKAIFLYKNIFIAINNQVCGIVIIEDDYSHFYICQ